MIKYLERDTRHYVLTHNPIASWLLFLVAYQDRDGVCTKKATSGKQHQDALSVLPTITHTHTDKVSVIYIYIIRQAPFSFHVPVPFTAF